MSGGADDLVVRAFRDEDEPAVVRLWETVFPDDPPHNAPASVIARKRGVQPDLFFVGLARDRVVATALAGFDGYRGWVYHLAVEPGLQGLGHGRALMAQVESALRERGCPKLNLQVRASNTGVIAFYRALGYAVEERVSLGKRL